MISIKQTVFDALINHARADAPIEACGYLAGADGIATVQIPMTNIDASPEHFSLDPKEQFSAVRQIRSQGLKLMATYHSHPASPARLSAEDIRLAFDPDMSYVIVSLLNSVAIKSFTVKAGVVTEEEMFIV